MRALRRFTVRAALPEPLLPLSQLVMNLRWSWHPETRDLFETLDPGLWQRCGGDPVKALGEVSAHLTVGVHVVTRFALVEALTALVAHGHLDELAMHVRAARRNGLTHEEIGAVLLQSAVYCGVPAANAAFAVAQRVLAEEPGQG